MMQFVIWSGVVLVVLGLIGLGYCIAKAMKLRKDGLSDEEAQAALKLLVPINYASVCFAGLGLCVLVVGLIL